MQSTIWMLAAVAVGTLAFGVGVAAWRRRRPYVAVVPATISVAEPVEDVLEWPRHAAEAEVGDTVTGAHRRSA
jgi:hypothetical protein